MSYDGWQTRHHFFVVEHHLFRFVGRYSRFQRLQNWSEVDWICFHLLRGVVLSSNVTHVGNAAEALPMMKWFGASASISLMSSLTGVRGLLFTRASTSVNIVIKLKSFRMVKKNCVQRGFYAFYHPLPYATHVWWFRLVEFPLDLLSSQRLVYLQLIHLLNLFLEFVCCSLEIRATIGANKLWVSSSSSESFKHVDEVVTLKRTWRGQTWQCYWLEGCYTWFSH